MGHGKYDHLCTYVREHAKADGAVVVVVNGERGGGCSVQAPPHLQHTLADMLTTLSESMRMHPDIPSAEDVRALLLRLSCTQMQELNRLSGVSVHTMTKIKRGETANPGIETVRVFYRHLMRLAATHAAAGAADA